MNTIDYRKDRDPKSTIKHIKNILKKNNIDVKIHRIKNIYRSFYSVRVELKGFYNIGANGKGLSKNLAMASAYAELMERLQSRMLINTYYLEKEKNNFMYSDEKVDINSAKSSSKILNSFFEDSSSALDFIKSNTKYIIVSKYYDVINNKYVLLPSKLINATSFSNGLCAGNSYYEAINQGICEILERYSYKTILDKNLPLKNVKIDHKLPIYARIEQLSSKGFCVQIKDCSLGKYPVIGVYITNESKDRYIFTLGSDVNIDIAIQRCLTEAFQGLKNDNDLIKKMKSVNTNYERLSNNERLTNWLKNYSSNNGIHPENIFKSNEIVDYKDILCFRDINDNESIYKYLLDIIHDSDKPIFIKDFSYLGFNTYKVYIPLLSNIEEINDGNKEIMLNYDLLKSIYFDLNNHYSKKQLEIAKKTIENVLSNSRFDFIDLGNYFHSSSFIKTAYNNITFELFYVLMCYKHNLKIELSLIKNKKLIDYINSINNSYERIIKDLNLVLPCCPKCETCKLKSKCKYINWKSINSLLSKKDFDYNLKQSKNL